MCAVRLCRGELLKEGTSGITEWGQHAKCRPPPHNFILLHVIPPCDSGRLCLSASKVCRDVTDHCILETGLAIAILKDVVSPLVF